MKPMTCLSGHKSMFRGAKNFKLKTIADKLGVTLDNAHRAVYDALATAEVFIKIQEIYEKDIENALNG